MSEGISLAQLAERLDYEAKLVDYCKVRSIENNEDEFVIHVDFLNGRIGEIKISR